MAHLANAAKKNLGGSRPKAAAGPGAAAEKRRRGSAGQLQNGGERAPNRDEPLDDNDDAKARRAQRLVMSRGDSVMDRTSQLKGSSSDAARGGLLARFKQEEANRWLSIALEYEPAPSAAMSRPSSLLDSGDASGGGNSDGEPLPPPPPRPPGSPQFPPHSFSPDEVAEFKLRFEAADEDGSGALSFDEVKELMRKANNQGGLVSNKKVAEIIALVDVNGDDAIDFDEYLACMEVMKSGKSGALKAFASAAVGKQATIQLPVTSVTGYRTPYFMVHPNRPWKIYLDLVIGALIVFSVFAVPFRIGFRVEDNDGLFWSDVVVDSFFGLDIILTFRTAYFDEDMGGFETNPWKVATRYLWGFFLIDFSSTVPIEAVSKFVMGQVLGSLQNLQAGSSVARMARIFKVLRLARLLKILRLAQLGDKGKRRPENDPTEFPTASSLGSMFAMLFFIAHLLCSTWYLILDESRAVNWLNRFVGEVDAHKALSLWERYVVAIYWAFTTMTTVGFGDLVATNQQEYLIGLLGMLIGASVFGYVIGNVTAMMESFDPAAAVYNEKMDLIKAFVKDRNLPAPVARRVRAHFKYAYLRTTVFDGTAGELQATLPAPAACAAAFLQFKHTVEALSFLRQAPPLFAKDLLACLRPFAASNGECITRDTDLGLCLYFLESGGARRYLELEVSEPNDANSAGASAPGDGPRRSKEKPSFKEQLRRSRSFDHVGGLASTGLAGKQLACALTLDADLGFAVTHHPSAHGGGGVLVVTSVAPGGQAALAGVQEGMSVETVNGVAVTSLQAFRRVVFRRPSQRRRSRDEGSAPPGISFVFHVSKREYKPFDDVEGDAVLGEAAVLLNTRHMVTTVATAKCELWFVSKEDLEAVLSPWPQVRAELCQRAVSFLRKVAACCAAHGDDAGGAATVRDMAPLAADEDLFEDDELAGARLPPPQAPYRTAAADALSGTVVGAEPRPKDVPPSLRPNMAGMGKLAAKGGGSLTKSLGAGLSAVGRRASAGSIRGLARNSKDSDALAKTPASPRAAAAAAETEAYEEEGGRWDSGGSIVLLPPKVAGGQRKRAVSMDAVPIGTSLDPGHTAHTAVPARTPSLSREMDLSVDEVGLAQAHAAAAKALLREEAARSGAAQLANTPAKSTTPRSTSMVSNENEEGGPAEKLTPAALFATTGLFHPSAPGKLAWDIFLSLVICYSVITVTYQLGFGTQFSGGLADMDTVVDFIFLTDILVTFNTAEQDEDGLLIVDRCVVAWLYSKSWFPVDFLSTVPIEPIVQVATGGGENPVLRSFKLVRAIRLVRLVKIARIITKSGVMDKLEEALGMHPAVLKVFKLFVIMLFVGHLFACVLFATAQCDGSGSCWVEQYCVGGLEEGSGDDLGGGACLDEQGLDIRYIASLYWAFTTMTTIGYGDITPNPKATHELVVTILAEVIGTTVFAYVVGALVGIIVNLDPGAKMRRQNLQYLNQYLNEAQNTFGFRRCLRLHLLFRQKVQSVFSEEALFAQMHPELRVLVMGMVHGHVAIPRLPELCAVEADLRGTFTVVLPRLRPYCYSIDDAVLHPMLGAHREMFFLTSGTVVVETFVDVPPGGKRRKKRGAPLPADEETKSPDGSSGPNPPAAPFSKRYTAGESFGEVLALLPDPVHFVLKVEARCTSTLAQAFGLPRAELQNLQATYPLLHRALCAHTPFEANFPHWVEVVAPRSFDYEAMVAAAGVRSGADASSGSEGGSSRGGGGEGGGRSSRELRESRVSFGAGLPMQSPIAEETEADMSRPATPGMPAHAEPPSAEPSSRLSRKSATPGGGRPGRRSSPVAADGEKPAVGSAAKEGRRPGSRTNTPKAPGDKAVAANKRFSSTASSSGSSVLSSDAVPTEMV